MKKTIANDKNITKVKRHDENQKIKNSLIFGLPFY